MRVTNLYEPKLVEYWNERKKRFKLSERQRDIRSRLAPLAPAASAATEADERRTDVKPAGFYPADWRSPSRSGV